MVDSFTSNACHPPPVVGSDPNILINSVHNTPMSFPIRKLFLGQNLKRFSSDLSITEQAQNRFCLEKSFAKVDSCEFRNVVRVHDDVDVEVSVDVDTDVCCSAHLGPVS